MKIIVEGRYVAKFAFRLFGRRFELGNRTGSFGKTLDMGTGWSAVRRHDFGLFEAEAGLQGDTVRLGLSMADGLLPIWSQEWDLGAELEGRKQSIEASYRGITLKGTVRVQND